MAKTVSMDDNSKKKSKKELAMIRRIEDMQNLSEDDYDKALKIIRDTSSGRRERQRRMKHFHRDVFPPID
tara:strand:- start:310 stop:519 length:210 start_codon:yes stop_codon:yes gene_type:complete